jgi:cation diffusion facilitator family transporter
MSNQKESVALSSVFASVALTATKFVVGLLTGSMGIMSEAAHSLLDFAAAVMTYFAVKHGDKPADEEHHYGHGKIESVSALAETGLLFLTSFWIIYEAVRRLIGGHVEVEATWYAFAVVIFSIGIDVSRSRALARVAKQTNSQALEADALHFSSDIWSSAVVLLGLVFVLLGVKGADAIAALGVAIFVMVAGYRLGRRTLDTLLDTAPRGTDATVRAAAARVAGVAGIERVRVRSLGSNLHVEISVQINRRFPLAKVQEICRAIEQEVARAIPGADVLVSAQSVQLSSETIVETVQSLAQRQGYAVHDVIVDLLDGRQYISYDLEVPDTLTVAAAHDVASDFEDAVKAEVGEDVELNSHIEPLKNEAILSSNVSSEDMAAVLAAVNATDGEVTEISAVHNVLVRRIGAKFFVSLHCCAPGDMSIEVVHNATSRFEYLMKDKMRDIKRVVIHVEPLK